MKKYWLNKKSTQKVVTARNQGARKNIVSVIRQSWSAHRPVDVQGVKTAQMEKRTILKINIRIQQRSSER